MTQEETVSKLATLIQRGWLPMSQHRVDVHCLPVSSEKGCGPKELVLERHPPRHHPAPSIVSSILGYFDRQTFQGALHAWPGRFSRQYRGKVCEWYLIHLEIKYHSQTASPETDSVPLSPFAVFVLNQPWFQEVFESDSIAQVVESHAALVAKGVLPSVNPGESWAYTSNGEFQANGSGEPVYFSQYHRSFVCFTLNEWCEIHRDEGALQ